MEVNMKTSPRESEASRGVKRPTDRAFENYNESPPKLAVTPRTRSRAAAEETPKTNTRLVPRSKLPIPICTPKSSTKDIVPELLKVPGSKTRRCRSLTPESSNKQEAKKRSRTKSPQVLKEPEPRTSRSRSRTPVTRSNSKSCRSRSNTPVCVTPKSETPARSARSKTPQKISSPEDVVAGISERITRKSPRLEHTPKISQPANSLRNEDVSHKTPTLPKRNSRRSRSRTPKAKVLDCISSAESKISCQKETPKPIGESVKRLNSSEKDAQEDVEFNTSTVTEGKDNTGIPSEVNGHTSSDCPTSVGCSDPDKHQSPSPSSSCMNTPVENTGSAIESYIPESNEELQKELEKVKKRRSTLGRGRKSGQSLGGRRSLCPALPIMSLQDQIANIDRGLPRTSQIGVLLDISIRETMRRFEDRFCGAEWLPDLRLHILNNSERIGGQIAYKIAGKPLKVAAPSPKKPQGDSSQRYEKLCACKKKTAVLEQEYKAWKGLLKERKLACQAAEREFREAKSGETKLDEESEKQLTTVQRNILKSSPDYSQFMKEVEMACETAYFATLELNHTASVVANFIKTTKAIADSCYFLVEGKTIGTLNQSPSESAIKTLLTLENDC